MKSISFYGAAGTVTGSSYLLKHSNKPGVLIDLGMYQGTQDITMLNQMPLQHDARQLAGTLLTHAHLDHCGRLPLLTKNGFRGPIFMTEPSLDMIEIALMDAARIAQSDDSLPVLYTEEDVSDVLSQVEIVDFDQPFELGGFTVTYKDAGHILGAASIEIFDPEADDSARKVVFSGDLGNTPHMMLPSPHVFTEADVVIMESTYGGRLHPHDNPFDLLAAEIRMVEETGGVLMIPAFAIERTQELLYMIKQLKDAGKVKVKTPIFLDSPMAIKVTDVYKRYGALYNDGFHDVLGKLDPFAFVGLHILERSKEGRIIDKTQGPRVIIAGSGMMSGGRILKHAQKYIGHDKTRILFIGYQGEETLGREILQGAQDITINEMRLHVKAHIEHIESMSAHADEAGLLAWLGSMHGVKKVFLTHGENDSRQAMAPKITSQFGIADVHMPELNDEISLL
jgi:metallo-beta-lactamase family protein